MTERLQTAVIASILSALLVSAAYWLICVVLRIDVALWVFILAWGCLSLVGLSEIISDNANAIGALTGRQFARLVLVILLVFGTAPATAIYLWLPDLVPGTQQRAAYLKAKQVEANARNKRAAIESMNFLAQVACWKAVRASSKFPSAAEFDPGLLAIPAVGPLVGDPTVIGVRGHVNLMNGFGLKIPHTYSCDVKDGAVIKVAVKPG